MAQTLLAAVVAGMKVVVVKCDEAGNIDIDDLRTKAEANKNDLGALMVTYPSTHGVFEEGIMEITKIIHENGGQVYMDGANMNAPSWLNQPSHNWGGCLSPKTSIKHLPFHMAAADLELAQSEWQNT